ncbi:MAG: hypothetical protein WD278_01240 [Pirellulales bacterium]
MSDKPRREKGGGAAVLAVGLGLLVALLMLYVLSIGPAARLASRSRIEQNTFFAIYQPIFLATRDTGADDVITEYIHLWGGMGVFFTADYDIPFRTQNLDFN